MKERCDQCKYFLASSWCRKKAPDAGAQKIWPYTGWARVSGDDWCGDFDKKVEE